MIHEKIIKDKRGEIKIVVDFVTFSHGQTDNGGNYFRYDVGVVHKAPRKHHEVFNDSIATKEEIDATKMELWEKMRPV